MTAASAERIRTLRPVLEGRAPMYAATLVSVFVNQYGLEALNWDPTTIGEELVDDYGADIDSDVFDKLMAAITVLTTDRVYYDVETFDETINAFSGGGLGEDQDAPTVAEMALTVAQIYLLDPEPVVPKRGETVWAPAIAGYGRVVLDEEGFSDPPAILNFIPGKPSSILATDEPDPLLLASSLKERASKAHEIDRWVDQQVINIVNELATFGIDVSNQ